MGKNFVPEVVVRRLPMYYRCLKELERKGVKRVSSGDISSILNITASQVRQDFSKFGGFGQQGYGYDVTKLKEEIRAILGLDKKQCMVIVGGGHIGQALANHSAFAREQFEVLAVFDIKTDGIDVPESVKVLNVSEFLSFAKENQIDICVIATQKEVAPSIVDLIKEAGIRAIWNFAPIEIEGNENLAVENVNLNGSLYTLSYMLSAL